MPPPALPFDPIEEARRHWIEHGWRDAADGMAAVTSLMRAQQILLASADRVLRPFGLTFARYEVLMLLTFTERGSLPLGKVGERLQVHAASVTNAVDHLEADGLVRRMAHPSDGRTTLAEITDEGRRTAAAATDAMNRDVFATFPLPSDEVPALFALLRTVREDAGDF